MTQNDFKGLPNYGNPPVIEVVIGSFFKKLDAMKLPHSGIFWQKIRKDFPKCTHAPSLYISALEGGELPLPRVWFINEDETYLIQYQSDCFIFNWRMTPKAEAYPRYSVVKGMFEQYHTIFSEFVQENNLGKLDYQQCELTYINHILKGSGWNTPADIGKIMRDVRWVQKKDRFLKDPQTVRWETVFPLPEDFGRLLISLKYGKRHTDNCPLFLLEISAKGLGGDRTPERISAWFDLAHEWIIRSFADVTNDEIQEKLWLRQKTK